MDSPRSHSLSDVYLFDGLKARDMAELMRNSQLRCVACAERDDFKASIRDQLFHLSIRSLKNLIALRGQTCKECKSKKFLQVRSMQIAHLPPKSQLLPILRFHNALIFPSIKAHLYLREAHDMVFMNKMWKSKSRRFGVMPNEGHGTVVKLLDYEALPDGRSLAVVQGIQRFTSNGGQGGKEIEQNGPGGIPVQNVTLFVDAPVFAKDMPEILDLAKRVRRAFHAFDTDAMAAQRAKTLGNPPEESLGAEVLSHWMSMALPMTHLERLWLMEVRSTRLRLAGLAEKLGVATEQDKRREEFGWEAGKAAEHKEPSAERARKGVPKGKGGKASAKKR
jgi:Lon protease-like protein